jgi:hypothetical protein
VGTYTTDTFWANKLLVAEAHASGLTRGEIVAEATKIQPCAGMFGDPGPFDYDHGLAMAMFVIKGGRMSLFDLTHNDRVRAGDWTDVEAVYGLDRMDDIRSWLATNEAYLASSGSGPEYRAFCAAADKIQDLLK